MYVIDRVTGRFLSGKPFVEVNWLSGFDERGVHLENVGAPKLVLLNKTCRLCLICETLIVDRLELERALLSTGKQPNYVVLGTIDRRTWRRGLNRDAALPDIREHMADFKKYLKVDIVPAHRVRSS